MQDKAGEIGEMIRELIILEIQKLWKEKKEEWMEQFEQRLRSLEEKSSTFPKQNVVLNQPRPYRMKGANIVAIRTRLHLTQAAFARLLNVDRANLHRWENDSVIPSPATVAKIASFRGMGKKALQLKLQELGDKMWNN